MRAFSLKQFRFISVIAAVTCISLETIQPASAQSTSINNVSEDVFNCMKKHTRESAGWIIYEGDSDGRIKVYAPAVGQVGEVTYSFNASQAVLNLTYVRGPAPLGQIQSGLNSTASKCRSGEYS